jgi:hypothetical protein
MESLIVSFEDANINHKLVLAGLPREICNRIYKYCILDGEANRLSKMSIYWNSLSDIVITPRQLMRDLITHVP